MTAGAFTAREKHFKGALLAAAQLRPGQRVLDVGCGTGTLAIAASLQTPGLVVQGLDGDDNILRRAAGKAERAGAKLTFRQGMSFAMPYLDNAFDRVLSSLFFHHLGTEDKRRTLNEIRRVMKPQGELYIADWGAPQNRLMRVLFYSIQLLDGFATTQGNVEGVLPELMREAGFADVRLIRQIPTLFGTMAIYGGTKPNPA
ncbi:class I SAM-dependent methyltransferase [Chromobacterium sphagni]|uniref:class I SAM-dependent methyltransferase n=1 Tax=Chromobacterium sphagni TaxID=1903179 RepID=UPI0009F5734A|nr:class I SAM-dependent methyltransferase [Chromobacterium sphagni]